jgi:hypothetical protein
MDDIAAKLAKDLGKDFAPPREGGRIGGIYTRPVETAAGRFALIEKSKEFSLVPWREIIERRRGLEISGTVRARGMDWDFGRGRDRGGIAR